MHYGYCIVNFVDVYSNISRFALDTNMNTFSIFKKLYIFLFILLVSCGERDYKSCQRELKKAGFDVKNQDDTMIHSAKVLVNELHGEGSVSGYCYGVGNFKDRRCYKARPLNGDVSSEYVACHFISKWN